MTDIEHRVKALETMFASSSATGMWTLIDKNIQRTISQQLNNLETRLIALIDAKVDISDCYLQFKTKVERSDFEKILSQVLNIKKGQGQFIEFRDELSKRIEAIEEKYNSQVEIFHSKVLQLIETSKNACNKIEEQAELKISSYNTTNTIKETEDEKLVNKLAEELKVLNTECKIIKDQQYNIDNKVSLSKNIGNRH